MDRFLLIMLFGILPAQEINWNDKPSPVTAIHIYCDTDGIPIFVDGLQVGASPIKDPSISENKKMRDMIQLARQDVLVEEGKTVRVVLSYRTIEAEAMEYEASLSSSRWVGLGMVFTVLALISWGLM